MFVMKVITRHGRDNVQSSPEPGEILSKKINQMEVSYDEFKAASRRLINGEGNTDDVLTWLHYPHTTTEGKVTRAMMGTLLDELNRLEEAPARFQE